MEPNGAVKRVELSNDQWVEMEVRPLTGNDLKFQRQAAHDRGFDDPTMNAIAIAVPLIKGWSLGEISLGAVEALSLADIGLIIADIGDAVGKAPLASSSAGGSTRKGRRRSNG